MTNVGNDIDPDNMDGKSPRQRRQEFTRTNGNPVNGTPQGPPAQTGRPDDETDENIFLFVPNLIGEH